MKRRFRVVPAVLLTVVSMVSGCAKLAVVRNEEPPDVPVVAAIQLNSQDAPTAFWHSQPVRPDQTVLIQGANLSRNTRVRLERLVDDVLGAPVTAEYTAARPMDLSPILSSGSVLEFILPANIPQGVFAYRLIDQSAGPVRFINAPDVWFIQGDLGNKSSPGGWVGVFGTGLVLSADRHPLVSLVKDRAEIRRVQARPGGNGYAQYFDLPSDLLPGKYDLYVHNGFGGTPAWVKYYGFDTAPVTQLTVVSDDSTLWMRAASAPERTVVIDRQSLQPGKTWDDAFADAFARMRTFRQPNGQLAGGTVHVAAGTYPLTRGLVLPERTVLAGDGMGRTVLRWDSGLPYDNQANTGRPLVRGEFLVANGTVRATFSLRDLSLHRTFVDYSTDTFKRYDSVCVERLFTREFGEFRRVECTGMNTESFMALLNAHQGDKDDTRRDEAAAFWLIGTANTEIAECRLDHPLGISLMGNAHSNEYLHIHDNTLRWRYGPMYAQYSMHNLVYERNTELMAGTEEGNGLGKEADLGDFFPSSGYNQRDVYFGENVTRREVPGTPHPQLGMTLDVGVSAYLGAARGASGTLLRLEAQTAGKANDQHLDLVEPGAVVQIVAGRGVGQWRNLTSSVLNRSASGVSGVTEVTVDRPWDVEPDYTSWVAIQAYQGHLLYHGNDLTNAPKWQIYYSSHDVVIAENTVGSPGRKASLIFWNGFVQGYGNLSAGWHAQVLDNLIRYDGATIANVVTPMYDPTTAPKGGQPDPASGTHAGYAGTYILGQVVRGNRVVASSVPFEIEVGPRNGGFLVEDNTGVSAVRALGTGVTGWPGILRRNATSGNRLAPVLDEKRLPLPANRAPMVVQ